jgi:hypothetical protein
MRRGLVTLVAVLTAVAPAALAIPLCEYRSPETDLADLAIGFAYQYYNNPFGLHDRDVNEGQFNVDYVRLYDRPEYGFDISFHNEMSVSVFDVSSHNTSADGNYRRYFAAQGDTFAFAGATARSSSSFQSLGLTLGFGVGAGRFVDVTPLARATRIDDYLVARGSLVNHLHPVDLQILADEIGSLRTYDSLAALVEAVQDVLEGSGNIRVSGLDALDISEITRLIQEEGFSRYCGWDLRIGLGYEVLDPSGGENDLLVTGGFDYAFATTPNEQFLVQGTFSGLPNLLETNRVDVTIAYDWILSDLLALTAAYDFSRETWVSEPTDTNRISLDATLKPLSTAEVTFSVVFEHRPYFTEWEVDLQLSIGIELL